MVPRPSGRRADEVVDVEGGLAEEVAGALLLQHQQAALDGADRDGGDVAVLGHQGLAALADVVGHGAQVLQVEQRHVLVGRHAEQDVEHALLRLVELEQPGEQQRPHLLHRGADGMALLAEQVPEDGRVGGVGPVVEADLLGALGEAVLGRALGRDAGEVALDVGGEHRHAGIGEALGQHLQRDGLAGAGGAGDQAVAVGELELQVFGLDAAAEEDLALLQQGFALGHGVLLEGRATGQARRSALIPRQASIGIAGLHVHRGDNRWRLLPQEWAFGAGMRYECWTSFPQAERKRESSHDRLAGFRSASLRNDGGRVERRNGRDAI